jgi:hypothetical protein
MTRIYSICLFLFDGKITPSWQARELSRAIFYVQSAEPQGFYVNVSITRMNACQPILPVSRNNFFLRRFTNPDFAMNDLYHQILMPFFFRIQKYGNEDSKEVH